MLLATAGQTATYVCNHAPASVPNVNSSKKLSRPSYKLVDSNSNTTSTASTNQASALMKTIAVRSNRNGGFHSAAQSVPSSSTSNNIKPSTATHLSNDNCVKKVIGTNAISNKNHSKQTASLSSTENVKSTNAKSSASPATSSTLPSSSSSSSTKKILSALYLKTYTVPPTDLHRYSTARSRSYSVDSLYDEMCHFKPIRSVPTTPWKCGSKSRGATIKAPKARLGQKSSNCDADLCTPLIRKNSKRDCSKAKAKIKPKLSANLFQNLKPTPSAFVRLCMPMFNFAETPTTRTQRACKRVQQASVPTVVNKKTVAKKQTKPKATKNQTKKSQSQTKTKTKIKTQDKAAEKNSKSSSNTRKRKAQIQSKKSEKTLSKRQKVDTVNRTTPPLTRRRIRLDESYKLYGPLA